MNDRTTPVLDYPTHWLLFEEELSLDELALPPLSQLQLVSSITPKPRLKNSPVIVG